MTRKELEDILDTMVFDMVIFDSSTFPSEIYPTSSGKFVRYAKNPIRKNGWDFTRGWTNTSYDYNKCKDSIDVHFTDYPKLFGKKRRLLNAIKDFV